MKMYIQFEMEEVFLDNRNEYQQIGFHFWIKQLMRTNYLIDTKQKQSNQKQEVNGMENLMFFCVFN